MKTLRRLFANINYVNLFATIVGSAIVAFGTSIHVDSAAADGGIIGLARIIEHFTDGQLDIWFTSLLINFFCYLLAWRLMDAKFIINMGIGTVTYSIFVVLFEPLNLDLGEYILLATFLGMVFIEVGTGLMLRYGSSPNGEQVLSMAISKKGDIDFGWIHFISDFTIILLFLPFTELESVIYSLILMTLTTPIIDYMVTAPKSSNIRHSVSKKKGKWIVILTTGLALIILLSAAAIYINDIYQADQEAISAYNAEYIQNVETQQIASNMTAYVPAGQIKAGFIFYPGARVEYTAYEPLLKACAQEGIICIVVQMPQNLAVLGINKGIDAMSYFPNVQNWYIGGHSLGGSMAASCAAGHDGTFKGVILLGSYSTMDISNHNVLSIYGSEDGVIKMNRYNRYKNKLPEGFSEVVIKGGNHAYFGMYGEQKNDGVATITNVEQINITANAIIKFILE